MLDQNPYQTIRQKQVYKTPWVAVREDAIIHPDGQSGIYSVVELPGFAVILPVAEDGRIHLVRLWRYPIAAYSWELPMGRVDEGEDARQAAERELGEETGLMAAEWQALGKVSSMNGAADNYGWAFVAKGLTGVIGQRDSEIQQSHLFSLAEISTMMEQGLLHDAETMAVLWLAAMKGVITIKS